MHMCRVYFHQATMGKSNQKIGKTNILVFEKITQLVVRALVVVRTKISKSKTAKQQDQGSKTWCYTESFMSLTISNLRTNLLCFKNIELLK